MGRTPLWLLIHNCAFATVNAAISAFNAVFPASPDRPSRNKIVRWFAGQKGLLRHIEETMQAEARPVAWFHAASLGEYAVVRPIMKAARGRGYSVVLTFFSPSGYEAVSGRSPENADADHVFYLPFDTFPTSRRFLRAVHPQRAVFAVSEYWPCLLYELGEMQVPVYVVSAFIREDSYLFYFRNKPLLRLICRVCTLFINDEATAQCLRGIGMTRTFLTGDPLFDNAVQTASAPYHDVVMERFVRSGGRVLVAGSVHDKNDVELVAAAAKGNPGVRIIYVPHDMKHLSEIKASLEGGVLLYSECSEDTDFSGVRTLVVDFVGSLSRIYRYGDMAYVGGGFTAYLHSVVEPLVYGLPVAFGPRTARKATAEEMLRLGLAETVRTGSELSAWVSRHAAYSEEERAAAKEAALRFVQKNLGATETIANTIFGP